MLKNENIICISSIDWDFVWQGHQEIMSSFAKNGNRVLFIENTGVRSPTLRDLPRLKKRIMRRLRSVKGFRQEGENLYIYSPLILPFPHSKFFRGVNKHLLLRALERWMKATGFRDPIIWTFLPTGVALDIINGIDAKLLVYYCIADFYELADHPEKIRKTEDEVIKKSDIVFVQGEVLGARCRNFNKNVYTFPFGVNVEAFEESGRSKKSIPEDIKAIKKPIIGYIGGVHKHIDFKLISLIAKERPDWSIVFIGPLQADLTDIPGIKNIFFLGKKDFEELPAYISEFDVGIIPYQSNEYTQTVYPTKLNEYHIMGKPVVSTDLPEINEFNKRNDGIVLVGRDYREFIGRIKEALSSDSEYLRAKRKDLAKKDNWTPRIEEMSRLIEEALEKRPDNSAGWQGRFLEFYRLTKKKLFGLAAGALIAYLLVFYTPLVWIAAEPLKISQAPQKADCIVVFAGGVGESGNAGQGFEERVERAVDLYKEGYAKNIIFSSGYMHTFKEPLVMKALAVSLGVPDSAIILENDAKNTYENVEFVARILDKNGWNNILLVSSPYHMLRASLVFKKIAGQIQVVYTPTLKSVFYSHKGRDSTGRRILRKADLGQVKGILHEYFGILYYWQKGYI